MSHVEMSRIAACLDTSKAASNDWPMGSSAGNGLPSTSYITMAGPGRQREVSSHFSTTLTKLCQGLFILNFANHPPSNHATSQRPARPGCSRHRLGHAHAQQPKQDPRPSFGRREPRARRESLGEIWSVISGSRVTLTTIRVQPGPSPQLPDPEIQRRDVLGKELNGYRTLQGNGSSHGSILRQLRSLPVRPVPLIA